MKRLFVIALAVAMLLGLLCGCAKSDVDESSTPNGVKPDVTEIQDVTPVEPELEWIDEPATDEEWMQNAIITSLMNLGNTHRLKNVIQRAKAGEELTFAYIGGSITHGEGASDWNGVESPELSYLPRTYKYFCETFAKNGTEQITKINAGIGATPSTVGALRFSYDVARHDPNVVFIEFAVNDYETDEHKSAFEGLVRQALSLESKPAVILVFARTDNNRSEQTWMKEIGYHYDVSMVSYADGVSYLIDNGIITWTDFSLDFAHPNDNGAEMIASFINHLFDEVNRLDAQGDADETYDREKLHDHWYENVTLLTEDTYEPISTGSWEKGSSSNKMTHGWNRSPGRENEPIIFEFAGKDAYLIWPGSGHESFGKISVKTYYNGVLVGNETINEFNGGWMGPMIHTLYRTEQDGEYKIEVSMLEGDEYKDAQILGIAYSKEDAK